MPELVFSVKGAQAVAASQDKIDAGNKKLAKGVAEHRGQLKLTSQELRSLDRLQTDIVRRHESAQDRYARKLRETRKTLAGHKDETKLLAKEQAKLRIEYLKATDGGKKAADGQTRSMKLAQGQAKLLRGEVTKLGAAQTTSFGAAALTRLAAWGAGFASVHTIIRGVTEEIRLQQELLDKRNAAQLTVSESRNVLLRNLVGSSPAEIEQAQAAAERISKSTGVSERFVNAGLAEAVSASGGNVPASVAAVDVATQYLRDRPEEIGGFAGSLLDLAKVTGTTDANVNLGLLSQVGKLGRVVKPAQQSENIAPALIGAASFGFDAQGGGALYAALSNAAADFQGRRTGTATVQLAKQLAEFEPLAGVAGGARRVLALQGNRGLAEEFLANASFETKLLGPVQDLLLRPQSNAAIEFRKNLGAIPGNAGLAGVGSDALGIFGRNSLEPVAARRRAFEAALEQLQVDQGRTGSLSREEREIIKSIAAETTDSGLGAQLNDFLAGSGDGGAGLTTRSALRQVRRIRNEQAGLAYDPITGSINRDILADTGTPQQQRDLAVLDALIAALEKAETERKAQTDRLETQADQQTKALQDIERNTRGSGGIPASGE